MPNLNPQTFEWINEAVELGYQDLSELYGYDMAVVHRMPVCRKMAASIVYRLLLDHDFEASRRDERPGWRVDAHGYAVIREGETDIVVDPTWQQLLLSAYLDPDLPRALIGPRDEVATRACLAGVDIFDLALWSAPDEYGSPETITHRHPATLKKDLYYI